MPTELRTGSLAPTPGGERSADASAARPAEVTIEDLAGTPFPTRHGMARLVPIRAGAEGRVVFAVDSFYGTRMAGHHPLLSGEGPRPLLSEATPLPAAVEDRLRLCFNTARRQEMLVHRAGAVFALELIPDTGGVTALWSELAPRPLRAASPAGVAPTPPGWTGREPTGAGPSAGAAVLSLADGQAQQVQRALGVPGSASGAMAHGASDPTTAGDTPAAPLTVDGDTVGCVVMRVERDGDGAPLDFVCEQAVADGEFQRLLPAAGARLSAQLSPAVFALVIGGLGQLLDECRPFRPPRGLFGAAVEARCDLRGVSFGDRVVLWVRLRPHTRSVVDLREQMVALTRREREILALLAEGASTTEIARTLYLSTNTVRNHVRRLLNHLGASSRLEAVVIAAKTGLLELRRDGAG